MPVLHGKKEAKTTLAGIATRLRKNLSQTDDARRRGRPHRSQEKKKLDSRGFDKADL